MKDRKIFFFVFCFILLDIFLLLGFLFLRDATSENRLRKEVESLSKLDITKDRYNTKIKSSGKYKVVEEAIKEYLDDYAVGLQEVSKVLSDSTLTKVLSYDNYASDGPEFTKSREYLNTTKEKFDKTIDELISKSDKETISNFIYDKTDDPELIKLYQELMLDDSILEELNSNKELLINTKVKVQNIIDTSLEVLNFLNTYSDSWVAEDGEIKFQNKELYNYYTNLIDKVKVK